MTAVSFVLSLVSVLGVIAVLVQLPQARRQRMRDFEEKLVQRYWNLTDQLPTDALMDTEGAQVSEAVLGCLFRYARLCEDEIELFQSGWIGRTTWREWHSGIKQQLSTGVWRLFWQQLSERSPDIATRQLVGLRKCMDDGKQCRCTRRSWRLNWMPRV